MFTLGRKIDFSYKSNKMIVIIAQIFYANIILLLFLFVEMSLNNLIIYLASMIGVIIYSFFARSKI